MVDGMLQKRQASKTVDLKTFSTNVNIITDPVSERRRQLALQVSFSSAIVVTLVLHGCYTGATLVLHWCYTGATLVLHWC